MPRTAFRSLILLLLAVLMAGTRADHFGPLPDASWAVFFIGGFYLAAWTRAAFPALMALAVAVDWLVISASGQSFWQHYCVSPGYWALVPAYFAMWAGGMWLQHRRPAADLRSLGLLAASVVLSVVVCQLISQGAFYWTSDVVAEPTLAGWWKNYTDWLLPFMATTARYVGTAALLHVAVAQAARLRGAPAVTR